MSRGETVKNGDFSDSEDDAMDAVVLYFQLTSNFPSFTSRIRSRLLLSTSITSRFPKSRMPKSVPFSSNAPVTLRGFRLWPLSCIGSNLYLWQRSSPNISIEPCHINAEISLQYL